MKNAKKRNTKKAFLWIYSLVEEKNIPFRASGGFAAKLYGADRALADIDIDYDEAKLGLIFC